MSEEQGEVAETEVPQAETQEIESPEEVVETVEEEIEEVDYEAKSKELEDKLEKETTGKQDKINKQRAALSQSNNKIQELQAQINSLHVVDQPKEPSIDDFDTHAEHQEAVKEYWRAQGATEGAADSLEKQHKLLREQKDVLEKESFLKQEQEYRTINPDYDRAKTEFQDHLSNLPQNSVVQDAIYDQASREGGVSQMIDYFGANGGENLGEFDRIAALSPVEAAVEIFKIQQTLKTAAPAKNKPLPEPIKSIKGKSKGTKALTQMSGRELVDKMMA